ncbi:endogenous retrovirus group K member 8 Gag polyprotein-like [Oryctolagus cuniculus]|uniref:endogenous retrovirus group K member 8 Gag polyprotein-like n=1 Tax=Oryctolagus cuniculus TaxID=9986 RepID=UPI00387798DC
MPVKSLAVCNFTRILYKTCPWFVEEGDLSQVRWRPVGRELQNAGVKEGVIRLWYLIDTALRSEDDQIGELLDEGSELLEELSEDSHDSSEKGDNIEEQRMEAIGGARPKAKHPQMLGSLPLYPELPLMPSAPPYEPPHHPMCCCCFAGNASSEMRPIVLESGPEKQTRRQILENESARNDNEAAFFINTGDSTPHPPRCLKPNWAEFFNPHQIFPVTEDRQGNRGWTLVDFTALKELQKAVTLYGPHGNFTKAILGTLGTQGLVPEDWRNVCKAVLSGGDYLLWSAAYRELACTQAAQNRADGQPAWNEDMLNGEGAFHAEAVQARCPWEVLQQIRDIALRAWKVVPKKGEVKHSLTKIIQGPTEPYADFINHLYEAAGNLFESPEEAAPLLRRLAYENANKTCRSVLRPWQHKDIPTFLKICRDVMDDVASGAHAAMAMAKANRVSDHKCFACGQPRHVKKECRQHKPNKRQPGLCPKCGKGNHWASDCYSKTDRAGNPIPQESKNGRGAPAHRGLKQNWVRQQSKKGDQEQ